MCRPAKRTGRRCLAAPAPPLRSPQGVCSRGDPSELARVGFYKGTCPPPYYHWSDCSIFGAQLWTEGHWLPVAPSNREPLQCLYVLRVCVWYLNDGTLLPSWTRDVWAAWRIGENSPDVKVGLRSAWKSHVIRETTGSTFHSRSLRRNSLFYRCTTTVYCILWPWMFIDGVGGIEQWKLYACQLCFTKQVMGLNFISIISILCAGQAELMALEHWSAF